MNMSFSPPGMGSSQKPNSKAAIQGVLTSILINVVPTFIVYEVCKLAFQTSDMLALLLSGAPAAIYAIVGIIRRHRMDMFSGITLLGIVVGAVYLLLGGTPRLYFLRSSLVPIAIGVAYLVSLPFPKPLWFYLGRHFLTGNDPQNVAWFNSLWQYPYFRSAMRLMTLVWGLWTLGLVVLYILLINILPISVLIVVIPIFDGVFWIVLLGWTFYYVRHMRKKLDLIQKASAAEVA